MWMVKVALIGSQDLASLPTGRVRVHKEVVIAAQAGMTGFSCAAQNQPLMQSIQQFVRINGETIGLGQPRLVPGTY
jgi:hypothetical protein